MENYRAKIALFSGTANPKLAEKIAAHLKIEISKATVDRFSDGEVHIEILENVRGKDVFIIQPICTPAEYLIELLIMIDALHRASAERITAVMPYFGYCRQDRRVRYARVPISAKVVADMISSVQADRALIVDLHADQIQGFFSFPIDNIYASPVLLDDINQHYKGNKVIVSPDVGGVVRARALAKRLDDSDLAIIDKRRPRPNESKVMNVIGTVKDKACIIIDDLVDTAGTLCAAATALKKNGAVKVSAYATHPLLSGSAIDSIDASVIDEVVVTDTIPLSDSATKCVKIRQISVSAMLAQAIESIHQARSISSLFP
ncbi:MAG: ribose-phosphate pyrophosphokinase [Chromatiales bacterium]|nr:ribose-phosphate pyrophosphokinase [Chromatiales bacterium]